MSRCTICGRRYANNSPRCDHEQVSKSSAHGSKSTASSVSHRSEPPKVVPGYRLEHVLGSGGFGLVMAAIRERDGKEVAIKTVHRDDAASCRRLVREAEALRAIGSPFVADLYDTGDLPDGSPYLVLEKLTIPSLDTKLGDPLDRDELAALANPIFTAVEACHKNGFVHRDLKPENIFVSGSLFTARLIDFGLAKSAASATDAPAEETMTGTLLGTPVYMSPEQCEGPLRARSARRYLRPRRHTLRNAHRPAAVLWPAGGGARLAYQSAAIATVPRRSGIPGLRPSATALPSQRARAPLRQCTRAAARPVRRHGTRK